MIRQHIYMPAYDWDIYVYYDADCSNTEEIVKKLQSLGAEGANLYRAVRNMDECQLDTGFTHSVYNASVVVVSKTSSADEFASTYDHEKGHLVRHISKSLGFDPYGEAEQYLAGEVSRRMYPVAKHFLCEHCREYVTND